MGTLTRWSTEVAAVSDACNRAESSGEHMTVVEMSAGRFHVFPVPLSWPTGRRLVGVARAEGGFSRATQTPDGYAFTSEPTNTPST